MTFRSVMISNAAYLQVKNKQLHVSINDVVNTVPIEDIACIIINHYQITLSVSFLSACADNNVIIISCDKKHIPNGIYHSYLPHSRQNMVLQKQLSLSQAFKKRLWQLIIERKINNQASAILRINGNNEVYQKLILLSQNILSGDKGNNEAQASKIYFNDMFGNNFTRIKKHSIATVKNSDYTEINAYLNYAYTIIRSIICRSIVGYGLLPTLGVFHDNQLNAFNLADDFIEPYRPYIDWYIYELVLQNCELDLNTKSKATLIDILNHIISIDDKLTTVLNSIDIMLKSYITCISSNDFTKIKLPKIPENIFRSNLD